MPAAEMSAPSRSVDDLRNAMTERIAERLALLGIDLLPQVERALRTVPRHLFTEGVSLEEAYGDGAVITNRDERGISTSSVSGSWLQAVQLCQAGVQADDHVLEIGSGGYNAALTREAVGPGGSVTSVDIDPAVIERASRCLTAAGYTDIEVIHMDAEHAIPGRTFTKIIVTAGAWDISPAWISQLAEYGRLVVPLRMMSLTRSWELERTGDVLVSRSDEVCGFVQIRGDGANRGRSVALQEEPRVGLWCDENQDAAMDADVLLGVLQQQRTEVWTDVAVAPKELYADQDLWLATKLPGYCHITASPAALESGIVKLKWQYGQPAFVSGDTVAYRPPTRPTDGAETRFVFGVIAHGPDSAQAAQRMAAEIVAWDKAGRPSPMLTVFPASTPDAELSEGFVLDKRHSRLVISWQPPAAR